MSPRPTSRSHGDGQGQVHDFSQLTRSRTLTEGVVRREMLETTALDLHRPFFPPPKAVRLIGVTVSKLSSTRTTSDEGAQLALGLELST